MRVVRVVSSGLYLVGASAVLVASLAGAALGAGVRGLWLALRVVRVVRWLVPVMVLGVVARPASAQLGIPGLPTTVIDPAAIAKLASQLKQMAQAITIAKSQLQAQLDATRKLASPPYRAMTQTMAQVDALTAEARALSYASRNLRAEFDVAFPGYQPGTFAERRASQERALASARALLVALSQSATQFPIAMQNVAALKASVATITSAQQAAELNAAIGIQAVEEQSLMRQQLAASSSMAAVLGADAVNRELQGAAVNARFEMIGATPPVARPRVPIRALTFEATP